MFCMRLVEMLDFILDNRLGLKLGQIMCGTSKHLCNALNTAIQRVLNRPRCVWSNVVKCSQGVRLKEVKWGHMGPSGVGVV